MKYSRSKIVLSCLAPEAYIASLKFEDISSQLSLVLISASSASENEFKLLHQARLDLQEVTISFLAFLIKKNFNREGLSQRLSRALDLQATASM
jgi:hypothetical protein